MGHEGFSPSGLVSTLALTCQICMFHTVREFNTHQNDHKHNQQVLDLAWQNGKLGNLQITLARIK